MLERIKASLPSLAPAEQRVGKLVLADPRAFANLPVTELADRAHVSKPTVVRFCRSMGYDGLSDFKLKLAGSAEQSGGAGGNSTGVATDSGGGRYPGCPSNTRRDSLTTAGGGRYVSCPAGR